MSKNSFIISVLLVVLLFSFSLPESYFQVCIKHHNHNHHHHQNIQNENLNTTHSHSFGLNHHHCCQCKTVEICSKSTFKKKKLNKVFLKNTFYTFFVNSSFVTTVNCEFIKNKVYIVNKLVQNINSVVLLN